MTIAVLFLLLQCSMWTCPVRVMNRTARGRSVAVPWSLFPREPTAGHVLSLSLIGAHNLCAIPSPIFLCVLVLSAYPIAFYLWCTVLFQRIIGSS